MSEQTAMDCPEPLGRVTFDHRLALPAEFYDRPVACVARDLLGAILVADRPDGLIAGRIVETEAYGDQSDPASHAAFRRNGLVRAMWGAPGTLYVFAAFGMYPCFNAVTGPSGNPSAVLIRALEIVHLPHDPPPSPGAASGPGRAGRLIGLTVADNGATLQRPPYWIQPSDEPPSVVTTPRVGISRGVDTAWRFCIAGHPSVSRPRPW